MTVNGPRVGEDPFSVPARLCASERAEVVARRAAYALPINTPEAKTSAPPKITCRALIQKLIEKYL
jgi:hypothetical protein